MSYPAPSAQPPEPPTADREWFGGRRWTGIFAIAMVLVIVLAVALFIVLRKGETNSETGQGSGPFAPNGVAPAPQGGGSSPTPTNKVPTTAPAGVTWSIFETVALPSLAGAGPKRVDGAIATGYTRTPEGALLAAANEGIRYGLAPDDQWEAAATAMLASGPGLDAWKSNRAAHPYGAAGASGGGQLIQIAGFQFVSYSPTDAVIQIVTQTPTGTYQVGAYHVVWQGGDWKYSLTSDGSQVANVQTVPSLAGFVEWRGV